MIKGVQNKESPKWLKDKLLSVGQKPISAIVDITNYVMLDINRPLHAYDADKIDTEIVIRNSKKDERVMVQEKVMVGLELQRKKLG